MKIFSRILLLLFLGLVLNAQLLSPITAVDISGDGAVHNIAPNGGTARWIQFIALATNSTATCSVSSLAGCPRVGDASISTTRGAALMPGNGFYIPESNSSGRQDLSKWYYLIQSGDKMAILYEQ